MKALEKPHDIFLSELIYVTNVFITFKLPYFFFFQVRKTFCVDSKRNRNLFSFTKIYRTTAMFLSFIFNQINPFFLFFEDVMDWWGMIGEILDTALW